MRDLFSSYDYLVGIDEVGRGPLAGPVTLASFALHRDYFDEVEGRLRGITDSKKLSEKKREHFFSQIKQLVDEGKLIIVVASSSAKMIEKDGIIAALNSALRRTLKPHSPESSFVFLDGSLKAPPSFAQETIVKGDVKNWLIGAASVVAKVSRDRYMQRMAKRYPEYAFEQHKGYGTRIHRDALARYGVCELHRKSWIKNNLCYCIYKFSVCITKKIKYYEQY